MATQEKPLFRILLLPVAVLAAHATISAAGLYESIAWIDTPMHFLGGLALGLSAAWCLVSLRSRGEAQWKSALAHALIALAFVGLATGVWELLEFAMDAALGTHAQAGLADTMEDVLLGDAGGALGIALSRIPRRWRG